MTSASSTPNNGSSPAAWGQTYQFYGFCNLTAKVLNGSTQNISVNPATNRVSTASYDANGNMTSSVTGETITYDEANRIASAREPSGSVEYFGYSPDNKRIYTVQASGSAYWTNSPTFQDFADDDAAIAVYPYGNNSDNSSILKKLGNVLAGIAAVAAQAFGANSSTYAAVLGLELASQDGQPINVTTFSGGAAALTSAVSFSEFPGRSGANYHWHDQPGHLCGTG